ncbi:hypothetical protein [Nocardioides jishulii]|uniref:Uncharacterized protein n=1 Tax=Nocardioides jishulii TaxID=2575440 RepID=A0A4U2YGX7_9ACTN|nr:hypothetical protein [Nocardioides jishulii]QCX26753.1 hypothetical protein FCL41_03730 [Nocardioides jishulii]TKI60277.1 hypothetical protein FC770_15820 [Nocardioides jishulii]
MEQPGGGTVGVHLERSEEHGVQIDLLAERLGGRTTLGALLDDLKFTATPSLRGRLAGRAVQRAIAFDRHDQADRVWWPQGVTTSADADPTGTVEGRRVVVTTWYAKAEAGVGRGSRLTFLDLDTLRYRHVLLVEPVVDAEGRLELRPVRIHAGGVVWAGPWFHVAATARGFVSCHVGDLMRVADDNAHPDEIGVFDEESGGRVSSFGHHYVLPVRFAHRAYSDEGNVPLRYSFLSLDRSTQPPGLLAGEYGRNDQSTRLAQFDLDAETWLPQTDESGLSRPVLHEAGTVQMQGAVIARGRHHISVSRGPSPGTIFTGQPGRLRRHRFATPMGPEDLSYWPETDTLWSVSEWPRTRWIYSMRRSWFD